MPNDNHASAQLPLVFELPAVPDLEQAFRRWSTRPHCVLLDSALPHDTLGRFSFLACDPFDWLEVPADGSDGLATLETALARYSAQPRRELPPFQGGAAGVLGYDLHRSLEQIPPTRFDEFRFPAVGIGLYDVVLAIDHPAQRAWLISHGFPAREPAARHERAASRLNEFRELLQAPLCDLTPLARSFEPVERRQLAPQYDIEGFPELSSNFDREGYLRTARAAIDYIYAGDCFQVNLSQRLLYPQREPAEEIYLRLRQRNPAPFAGYLDLGEYQLLSASPERFVCLTGDQVEARPIKGTRRRSEQAEASLYAGEELKASEKDRAENVMIVDLLRNDLSRVCRPESIRVTQLCGLEQYQYVQHLVSVIRGQMADGMTAIDLLRASFPGGSIVGAPKVRAMEIIAELEPVARGAYCGSLGYIGFDGTLDQNILIRTITAGRGWLQMPVGGGIVAQSSPAAEYEETWTKAAGLLKALRV
jgi:para-aminobenzoate synthetase component I